MTYYNVNKHTKSSLWRKNIYNPSKIEVAGIYSPILSRKVTFSLFTLLLKTGGRSLVFVDNEPLIKLTLISKN